jgi:hypothetical protein
MRVKRLLCLTWLVALIGGVACKNDGNGPAGPDGSDYDPMLDPADFVAAVTNPFFPLVPGRTYTYEGETAEGTESIIVEVLHETKTILGITATVVHDRVYLEGDLIEDTFDWYAQNADGDVWYLGEDSKEIENGQVVSTDGSWEAGVDDAKPGIIMWADPAAHVGEEYRQEYYEGEAEDWGEVVALNQTVDVPFGHFTGCVTTADWNGIEPGVVENKYYCPEIGATLEVVVGGDERVELVGVTGP